MSCNDRKWTDKTCDICGIGSKIHATIIIQDERAEEGMEFPYFETDLCKKHFGKDGKDGLEIAMQSLKNLNYFIEGK